MTDPTTPVAASAPALPHVRSSAAAIALIVKLWPLRSRTEICIERRQPVRLIRRPRDWSAEEILEREG